MRLRTSAALVLGLLALGTTSCSRQSNATVNPWSQSTPGSWVSFRTVLTVTRNGKTVSHVTEEKLTVKEMTSDKIVLERQVSRNGQSKTSLVEVPKVQPPVKKGKLPETANNLAVAAAVAAAAEMEIVANEGEETLDIGGQPVQASWTAYGKGKATKKEWTSPDVPGQICKRILRMETTDVTQELVQNATAFEKK
jgi:hypothetical protein